MQVPAQRRGLHETLISLETSSDVPAIHFWFNLSIWQGAKPRTPKHEFFMSFYKTIVGSVTQSRGARPFWNFIPRCHRIDKKDRQVRWTNQDSIRHTVFQVCVCVKASVCIRPRFRHGPVVIRWFAGLGFLPLIWWVFPSWNSFWFICPCSALTRPYQHYGDVFSDWVDNDSPTDFYDNFLWFQRFDSDLYLIASDLGFRSHDCLKLNGLWLGISIPWLLLM